MMFNLGPKIKALIGRIGSTMRFILVVIVMVTTITK